MKNIKNWFILHFVVDYLFAIPLFIAPEWTLSTFGWGPVDPVTTRLVAAAPFGIGGISLVHRNANQTTMRAMLDLKLIWSATAVIGLLVSITNGVSQFHWFVTALFTLFFFVWLKFRREI